jgi:hypothetical protein
LQANHRLKGNPNKINADIKSGCIEGFAAHGLDGKGKLGFPGFIQYLAEKHPKSAARIVEKLLPLHVSGSGFQSSPVGQVNVYSVPAGHFLKPGEMQQLLHESTTTIDAEVLPIEPTQPAYAGIPAPCAPPNKSYWLRCVSLTKTSCVSWTHRLKR